MCLTDQYFNNTPNGDVVDKLITELWRPKPVEISSNELGFSEAVFLNHGDYEVTIWHPTVNLSTNLMLKVTETSASYVPIQLDAFVPLDIM